MSDYTKVLNISGGMPRGTSRTPRGQDAADKTEVVQLKLDGMNGHIAALQTTQLGNVLAETIAAVQQQVAASNQNPTLVKTWLGNLDEENLKVLQKTTTNKNIEWKTKSLSKVFAVYSRS